MENQDDKERRRLRRELEAPLHRPAPSPRLDRAALARQMGADVEVIRGR